LNHIATESVMIAAGRSFLYCFGGSGGFSAIHILFGRAMIGVMSMPAVLVALSGVIAVVFMMNCMIMAAVVSGVVGVSAFMCAVIMVAIMRGVSCLLRVGGSASLRDSLRTQQYYAGCDSQNNSNHNVRRHLVLGLLLSVFHPVHLIMRVTIVGPSYSPGLIHIIACRSPARAKTSAWPSYSSE
jgi:hypothetical protein